MNYMYTKTKLNDQFVQYEYQNKFILLNTYNGQWWVYNSVNDLTSCLTAILNGDLNHEAVKQLTENNFFQELEEYSNPTLQFHVTNKCNLRCKHCYMKCETGYENELTYTEITKLIDDFCACGGKQVVFTGGEVLLKAEFVEILAHAKKRGLYTIAITNGTLWTDDLIDKVSKHINQIQISLDGYDEDTNAQVRGKGVFSKALECADKLLKKGVEVIIAFTPMYDYDKEKYIEFGKILVDKYADCKLYLDFAPWILNGRSVSADVRKNEKYYKDSIDVFEAIFPGYETSLFTDVFDSPVQNCGYGKVVLNSNGDFAFCSCLSEIPTIGNVREMPMQEIFELSKIVSQKTCVDNLIPCNNCDFRHICGGSCRMVNFENSNKIADVRDFPALTKFIPCTQERFEYFLKMMIIAHGKREEKIGDNVTTTSSK